MSLLGLQQGMQYLSNQVIDTGEQACVIASGRLPSALSSAQIAEKLAPLHQTIGNAWLL